MSPWAVRNKHSIPNAHSQSSGLEMNDYSNGMNNYVSNDKFPVKDGGTNMWRLAQDARIITLGDYDTRKGFDFHSAAAGETQDQTITSVTGASDKSFNSVTRLAQKFTAGTSGKLAKLDINLKNDAGATGTVMVGLYSDSSSAPGTLLDLSSIDASTITSSYAYYSVRFPNAPTLTATSVYWIVVYVQAVASGSYKWSGTTSATTAKTSTDSGSTWSSTSYALNFKQYYGTTGAVKGIHRAYKSDGTAVTLMAHGTSLYKVDEVTGALTAIKTGLNASATLYRFWTVNDVVYYVNSYDGLRKWDFTTESSVDTSVTGYTNFIDVTVHKGLLMLVAAADPTRLIWSNFADYETFTSTDFSNVPAPKTGDPIASIQSLNGYLLVRTNNRCFILSGDDNATFRLDDAPDQKGTYTPLTSVVDKSYNYYLSDDGVYRSNGTQPELLSENIYEAVRTLNRDGAVMAVNRGRLYLWYRSSGSSFNDSCYVWNLNYKSGSDTIESSDTRAYVAHATSGFQDDDNLLVGSSVLGAVYWQEKASNDYTNLGGLLDFDLQTHYFTFSSPSMLKEVRYWQPRFGAQDDSYTVDCEYAYDLRDNWTTYSSPNIQGAGPVWGSGIIWGAFTWGTTAETQSQLYVPGSYRRVALRYRHYATRQPVSFLGHTLTYQVARMR